MIDPKRMQLFALEKMGLTPEQLAVTHHTYQQIKKKQKKQPKALSEQEQFRRAEKQLGIDYLQFHAQATNSKALQQIAERRQKQEKKKKTKPKPKQEDFWGNLWDDLTKYWGEWFGREAEAFKWMTMPPILIPFELEGYNTSQGLRGVFQNGGGNGGKGFDLGGLFSGLGDVGNWVILVLILFLIIKLLGVIKE